jgi:DNA-binding MarR family transcriptional regulator
VSRTRHPTRGGPRLAGLLVAASEQVNQQLVDRVGPKHPELRRAHFQLFRFGTIDGWRITDLAAEARTSKQSIHELIGHLEAHGYLLRIPDPADSRARLVQLTAGGRQLEDDLVGSSRRIHAEWRESLGAEAFEALCAALRVVGGKPA